MADFQNLFVPMAMLSNRKICYYLLMKRSKMDVFLAWYGKNAN